jgi:spore germination cell wall hydrolase CwlJ-like protein
MARRRRYRRRKTDPTLFIAAGAVVAACIICLIAWHLIRERPAKRTMEQARAVNASIPFVANRGEAASPFHFRGTPAARERAVQCLAAAARYEAGSDEQGEKAVIQVVLNRVRLPQYPSTVCGVVYQGSTLSTGCQFSFACDGSRIRRPEYRGWRAARRAARRALDGYVFRPVGRATHYHADWIVPDWIGSLDKIAQVHTHIFYRLKERATGAR